MTYIQLKSVHLMWGKRPPTDPPRCPALRERRVHKRDIRNKRKPWAEMVDERECDRANLGLAVDGIRESAPSTMQFVSTRQGEETIHLLL